MSGGVVLYAAQSNPLIDAEIAEKGRFRTKTFNFGGSMRNKGFVKIFMLIVIVLLLGVVGFLTKEYLPFGFTEIAQINENPNKFEGQQVKVKGEVVDRLKIPFIDSKSYVLDDGTGRVTVVTNTALPEIGVNVAIIAIGSNTAIIGGESIGFRLQEIKVLPETALFFGK